jgi:hypothetical protein
MSNPSTGILRSTTLQTAYKPYTIDELVTTIYEENLEHFEFIEQMNAGDCDCRLHMTLNTILEYWGE